MSDGGGRLNYRRRVRSQSYRSSRASSRSDFSSASGNSNAGGCAMLFNLAGAAAGAAAGYAVGGTGMAVVGGFMGLFSAGALTASL